MSEGMIKEERGKRNLQRTTTKGSLVAEMAPQADPHYLLSTATRVDFYKWRFFFDKFIHGGGGGPGHLSSFCIMMNGGMHRAVS
jgi:hypothetical protein